MVSSRLDLWPRWQTGRAWLGMAWSCAHLALLRHELLAVGATSLRARDRLVRGLAFRVLMWAPAIVLATQMGPAACLGSAWRWVGRWWLIGRVAKGQ